MTQTSGARVVVTGMGVVNRLGETVDEFHDALVAGRSGITTWKNWDGRCDSKIGGDMSAFDFNEYLARCDKYSVELSRRARRLFRPTPLSGKLSACASLQAVHDAGFPDNWAPAERIGHVLAGHNLNAKFIVDNVRVYDDEPEYIDPLLGLVGMDTDCLAMISELLDLKGPCFLTGGACASGGVSIIVGADMLRLGRADLVLVTGAASEMEPVFLHGWALMEAISYHSFNDDPTRASRPFDALREGFVPSQGAGALVLETLQSAQARGAAIHAEIYGGACGSDACRLPKPNLAGQIRVIRNALLESGVEPEEVDYINAHGPSTPLGDRVEVSAIKECLGKHSYRIPINSTKSMIGHSLAAAGVIEIVATIMQMKRGVVHPTINQEKEDPELDLDFVPNSARKHDVRVALSNSFGFGGINSAIVVGTLR